ncbi:MAG: redoxin domain-containing protein [Sneathiella sp.]|nr:redoxin domain-containing protein [Sneathiella sp.]
MTSHKLSAGSAFPKITVPLVTGGEITLGSPSEKDRWTLVVVYRGRHCPLCVKYLDKLEELAGEFSDKGTDVIALSGDGLEKAKDQVEISNLTIPVGYGLTIPQMQEMGLYISHPRSPEETNQPFPEPGLFALRPDGVIQIVDISNAPFSRPDLSMILRGIEFGREKGYPVRGTY